jgi:hypothetical protein
VGRMPPFPFPEAGFGCRDLGVILSMKHEVRVINRQGQQPLARGIY